MPRRSDMESILVVGAGPIVIGQACEFDYSGVQACKVLRKEGYRVILANSNPATIMTDPDLADATYIEPIVPESLAAILEKERPCALLATMGGQTALNTTLALANAGVLEQLGVRLIGADRQAIEKAEDRELFRAAMTEIGLETPQAAFARSLQEAQAALERIGLPAVLRPSFTLGGFGGGIAYNRDEFFALVEQGLAASFVGLVLVEEYLLGWKEYEMEVMRDAADNAIIVCSIENIDPMGVHTGDSITVAPSLTLTDKEYQRMRDASIAVLRKIGVETGGSNVQFAVDPANGRQVVIEMNPRVSRSSALASKATGFPIAKVAAQLAVGYHLDELKNDITRFTPASFEPCLDYVVTKIPRFAFEKFPGVDPILTTSMKSVGEVMAIGRDFPSSLHKALQSLERDLSGLDELEEFAPPAQGNSAASTDAGESGAHGEQGAQGSRHAALRRALGRATPETPRLLAQALRLGMPAAEAASLCGYDPWFVARIEEIVATEAELRARGLPPREAELREELRRLKTLGFSDARLGHLCGLSEAQTRARRHELGVRPCFKRIDSCAAEFEAHTPYLYSCYEQPVDGLDACEAEVSARRKVILLGSGPNRIGQGIEFDYCCCHGAFALKDMDVESIMINCNPETVSTDYDTSDRLYFEPLNLEHVLEIIHVEQQRGELLGVIVQFGGQTPLRLAHGLLAAGVQILGTPVDAIDRAEDRERFRTLLEKLSLRQPDNAIARNAEEAFQVAETLGYPLVIRPSYVLGGRAMEIVHGRAHLQRYIGAAAAVSGASPVLLERYLADAIEVDADVLCDGEEAIVVGVMEHIEEAGVHSGDSACVMPPHSLGARLVAELERQSRALALELGVVGLMNVQYAIRNDEIFVLEVNPRASRSIPFVAKMVGMPVVGFATRLMLGDKLKDLRLIMPELSHVGVKEAVFPFVRFPGVDTVLGPEMRSTGEAMGIDRNFPAAFAKSQMACGLHLPRAGTVFVSVKDADKHAFIAPCRELVEMGFSLLATGGTARHLAAAGLQVESVKKVLEGRPHILDAMKNKQVQLVFNTTEGAQSLADSLSLRRTALGMSIPYCTTRAGALAMVQAIGAILQTDGGFGVISLQELARERRRRESDAKSGQGAKHAKMNPISKQGTT